MKKLIIIMTVALFTQGISAQTIDRTHKPKPGPMPIIKIGDPIVYKLANGITILVMENHKLPKVLAGYYIDAGPVTEGSKAGVVNLMGNMLNEGTTTKTKAQFDETIDQIGAEINLEYSGGQVSALTRYFSQAFYLMAEGIRHPLFSQASFKNLKSQAYQKLEQKNTMFEYSPGAKAIIFGKTHPYGEIITEESINAITLDDVKETYKKYITPSKGYLIFIGDIKPEAAKLLAEKAFGDWKGNTLTLPILAKVNNPAKTEVDVVNVNKVQSDITVSNLIDMSFSNPDYFALALANQILGGGTESRLYDNLTEKHGFTYGAYSYLAIDRFQSSFYVHASVRNKKVDSAVLEILKEINTIRTVKVPAEELQNAKNSFNGSFALKLEDPILMAVLLRDILMMDLPKNFYSTFLQKIDAVTGDDILRVAKKYFNYDNTRIVIVGETEQFVPGLKKAGFKVNEFDHSINLLMQL